MMSGYLTPYNLRGQLSFTEHDGDHPEVQSGNWCVSSFSVRLWKKVIILSANDDSD
jgi:hypothetical protein